MTHSITARVSVLGAALLAALASMGVARDAQASPDYPVKLQAWLENKFKGEPFCAPQCNVCHLTNLGGPGMLNVFGQNLKTPGPPGTPGGLVGIPNNPNFAAQLDAYFAAVAAGTIRGDSDGDGVPDLTELQQKDSPATPLPLGKNQLCPDIEYGCAGGRIAAAPLPMDRVGLFSAGAVVFGFAAIRRRRRRLAKRAG